MGGQEDVFGFNVPVGHVVFHLKSLNVEQKVPKKLKELKSKKRFSVSVWFEEHKKSLGKKMGIERDSRAGVERRKTDFSSRWPRRFRCRGLRTMSKKDKC